MTISVFNLFSIGIGPSSSHTVGPMKAAKTFADVLVATQKLTLVTRIKIELFGSLAYTGKGHGTDGAVLLGIEGNSPDTVDPEFIKPRAHDIITENRINVAGTHSIPFNLLQDLEFNFKELLPAHTNGMRFIAYDSASQEILSKIYYSIGGGFIAEEHETSTSIVANQYAVPFPFNTPKE